MFLHGPCRVFVSKGQGCGLKESSGNSWKVITARKKHSPWKGKNGDTPIGYSGRAALKREQRERLESNHREKQIQPSEKKER
jgi:hypothetical protein